MSISVADAKKELSQLLEKGKLCIFAGSGVSVPAPSSLPTWDEFVSKYIEICRHLNQLAEGDLKFDHIVDDADSYKSRDVITTLSALKDRVSNCRKNGTMSTTLYDIEIQELFAIREYNKLHEAIIDTNYKYILTTNYDTLLEKAAMAHARMDLLKRVYSYKDLSMISEAIYLDEPAIIHMHGVATEIALEEFILTKDDYKRIRDKNIGFRTLINALFMNHSMLMVGYGSSDPHLEDVIDDINMSLGWLDNSVSLKLPIYYLIVKKDKLSPIFDHIKNRNRTKVITVNDYSEVLDLLEYLKKEHPRK